MAYLTPEGLEKFKKELDQLENVKRKELAEKLNYAISFGDLKENAAYHEAKEAQGFLEGRILELKSIISSAKLVENSETGRIQIGSVVLLDSNGEKEEFKLVSPEEADVFAGKISYRSPLGGALMGKRKGDKISVHTPNAKTDYEVIDIK